MKLKSKLVYAKRAIDSIIDHDDVIMEAVEMSATELHAYIEAKLAEAKERRAAAAGVILAAAE